MSKFFAFQSLKIFAVLWTLGGLVTGGLAVWIWMGSQAAWRDHLNRAYETGVVLYESLRQRTEPPQYVQMSDAKMKGSSDINPVTLPQFANLPARSHVTSISISTSKTRLQLHIVSTVLSYPLAKLPPNTNRPVAAQLGEITQMMASYCSNPILFARFDQSKWIRIEAPDVWGCDAAPKDKRLIAIAILLAGLVFILSHAFDVTSKFSRFAIILRRRGVVGGNSEFTEQGPNELREVMKALNEYLAHEQDRLEKRAMVLSGVSHDLGTPATRLRLRAALIEDKELRRKLETDIDQMTGMIESVLTYTRSEMNAEEPRKISLTSLVQSIVDDYNDIGKPVQFLSADAVEMDKSRSVFGAGGGNIALPQEDARRVLVTARPVSLGRAVANLIDNALKYGRRATVSVRADSETAVVIVDDEGGNISDEVVSQLTGPFLRGQNADFIEGVGLGLTIVSTIARQHGGAVSFEHVPKGLRAKLTIRRH